MILVYANGCAEQFFHTLMIVWCFNELYSHTSVAKTLNAEDQENVIKLRELVAKMPNAYIVGPGDGVCWKDSLFDEKAKTIIAEFTSHNVPYYNPNALWRTMEHKFVKKSHQTKYDPWHFNSQPQTKAQMVEALSMTQDMHDMRLNLMNISRHQSYKQAQCLAWKESQAGGNAERQTRTTSLAECRRLAKFKPSKVEKSTPAEQSRERTPRLDIYLSSEARDRSRQAAHEGTKRADGGVKPQYSPPTVARNVPPLPLEETKNRQVIPICTTRTT